VYNQSISKYPSIFKLKNIDISKIQLFLNTLNKLIYCTDSLNYYLPSLNLTINERQILIRGKIFENTNNSLFLVIAYIFSEST